MYQKAAIKVSGTIATLVSTALPSFARTEPYKFSLSSPGFLWALLFAIALLLVVVAWTVKGKIDGLARSSQQKKGPEVDDDNRRYLSDLNASQIGRLLKYKKAQGRPKALFWPLLIGFVLGSPSASFAQTGPTSAKAQGLIWGEAGVVITLVLLAMPILLGTILLAVKVSRMVARLKDQKKMESAARLAAYLESMPLGEGEDRLQERKRALDYALHNDELAGKEVPLDEKGLLRIDREAGLRVVAVKKKAIPRPNIDPALSKLIIAYLLSATFWLLFGTTVGEYVGIKFVAPDLDAWSALSFGRLRPVHTNAVFWGWASMGMVGLAYYVVPRVSNVPLYSIKLGWWSLHLINLSVVAGTLSLMAGINNGGGEYREYIWPVMLPFGISLFVTLVNFYKTIAVRKGREIYISNWYIVSAVIFTLVIAIVAYLPFWQKGLGETIVQGYYMHQGVGMWFMLFTLGLVYYFLPQQLNKPIYSYSLGILAFWTQILFYTLIGSHHFVFSAIPWWLQTVAIVGSAGMAIPVIAGTTNFLLTFKGAWYKIADSYTLPFFLVGVLFYFTGSMQGTAEAFRTTNLIWHFTDFTVAHSHLTMYGIICFLLWACMYALVPRLTGVEAPQITIGAHFWLALLGLLFYTIPLMYGSTLKGLMWMEGKPFIDGVVFMAPYWLWRAIGGSLMWLSHIFFAYNMYKMVCARKPVDVAEEALNVLEKKTNDLHNEPQKGN